MKWIIWFLLYLVVASANGQTVDKFNAAMPKAAVRKIIFVPVGKQPGLNLTGHSNEEYVITGPVIFTSSIQMGNTFNITFNGQGYAGYGFTYAGTGNVFNSGIGNNINDSVYDFDFGVSAVQAFDAVTKIFVDPTRTNYYNWQYPGTNWLTYDGTPQTLVWAGLYVQNYHVGAGVSLFQGSWENCRSLHMVCAGMTFNIGVMDADPTKEFSPFHAVGVYGVRIDKLLVLGNSKMGTTDYGTIFIDGGNGQITNMYRAGKIYGYCARYRIAKLAGLPYDQSSSFTNSVDANSLRYGTVDVKVDSSILASNAKIAITATDFTYINNTSIYKRDDANYYVTAAVISEPLRDDLGYTWTLHVKNSYAAAAANTTNNGGSSLFKNNSNGQIKLDFVNNIDIAPGLPVPAYLDSNYFPLPGSYLDIAGIGATVPKITPVPPTPCPPCPIPLPCPKIPTVDSVRIYFSDGTIIKK